MDPNDELLTSLQESLILSVNDYKKVERDNDPEGKCVRILFLVNQKGEDGLSSLVKALNENHNEGNQTLGKVLQDDIKRLHQQGERPHKRRKVSK